MAERLVKSNKIRIGDISISYYIKKGKATASKTIIFLHGFPFNKNMWREQLDALPDDVTGVAVDIRGHGNSTAGHGYFSIDVFAKDLRVLLDKLEIDQAILCGISMGGYIALRAYELFPEKIVGLVLCDTHSKADSNTAKQKRFDSIQAVLNHGRRPFAIGFVENVFAPQTLEGKPETVELIKRSIRRNSISTICATLLALASRTDTSESLYQITVPVLLIRGAQDKITAKQDMQDMADAIPSNNFVEIEHAGHLPNLDDPIQFNRLLLAFVEEL